MQLHKHLFDNKHKRLEKNISVIHWNQMFLKVAKELKMKEAMAVSLWKSVTQTSKAIDKIAESISYFEKAFGHGWAMIAPPQRQLVLSTPQASQMQILSSHPPSQYQSPLQNLKLP